MAEVALPGSGSSDEQTLAWAIKGVVIAAGATWTSAVVATTSYTRIVARLLFSAELAGTLIYDLGNDGTTWPVSIPRPWVISAAPVPTPILASAKFARVRITNSGPDPITAEVALFLVNGNTDVIATINQVLPFEFPVTPTRPVDTAAAALARGNIEGVDPRVWITRGIVNSETFASLGPLGWDVNVAMAAPAEPYVFVSTDATDDASSTGATAVLLEMVEDGSGRLVREIIPTNGLVSSVATSTTGFRLQRAGVATIGTPGARGPVGTITITTETSGDVVGVMLPGEGVTFMGLFHIVEDGEALLIDLHILPQGARPLAVNVIRRRRANTATGATFIVLPIPEVVEPLDLQDIHIGTWTSRDDIYLEAKKAQGGQDGVLTVIAVCRVYNGIDPGVVPAGF